jgi:hypothetical protein
MVACQRVCDDPEAKVYAILGDGSDMLPHQPHFKASFFRGGLTEKIAQIGDHIFETRDV